jgi:hypothetical protein
MYSVLEGFSVKDIQCFFEKTGTGASWYHKNSKALRLWLFKELLNPTRTTMTMTRPAQWIAQMVCWERKDRISSSQLVKAIAETQGRITRASKHHEQTTSNSEQPGSAWCGECCLASFQDTEEVQYNELENHGHNMNGDDRSALMNAIVGSF